MKHYLLVGALIGVAPAALGMQATLEENARDLPVVLELEAVRANLQAQATCNEQMTAFYRMHMAARTLSRFAFLLAEHGPLSAKDDEQWTQLHATLSALLASIGQVSLYSQMSVSSMQCLGISLKQGMSLLAQTKASEHATKVTRGTTTEALETLRKNITVEEDVETLKTAVNELLGQKEYICTLLQLESQEKLDAVNNACEQQQNYAQQLAALTALLANFNAKASELDYWYNLLCVVEKAQVEETAFDELARARAEEVKSLCALPIPLQEELAVVLPLRESYKVSPNRALLRQYFNGLYVLLKSVHDNKLDGLVESISQAIERCTAELQQVKSSLVSQAPGYLAALKSALVELSEVKRPFEHREMALACINGIEAAQILADLPYINPVTCLVESVDQMITPWHSLLMKDDRVSIFHASQTLATHGDWLTSVAHRYAKLFHQTFEDRQG